MLGIGSGPSKTLAASALVWFPVQQSCWDLVGYCISPAAAVEQADPQRCFLVRGKWTDHVHLGELR